MSEPTTFLTDADVAARFGISKQQVQDNCRDGRWPHIKIGRRYRFTEAIIDEIANLERRPASAAVTNANGWGVVKRGGAA